MAQRAVRRSVPRIGRVADRVQETWSDADVPEYLERLGVPGLVDVHVHFMEPSIMAKVWAYFDAAGPKLGREWPITYRGSDDERLARLRALGVKRFSALSYAHRPGVAAMMNDWTLGFAEQHADVLRSATFFPEPEAPAYVADLIDRGVDVFKVHVQVGDFPPNDPLLEPVWALLAEAGTPIVLHAGSGPAPGRFTGPAAVADVLTRHPDLAFVMAHLGAPELDAFATLAEHYEHVRLDTTMAFVDFFADSHVSHEAPEGYLERLAALQDKVLFGSDFPNIPYQYAHQIEALDRLGLGDAWMRAVLWENGARLFDVTP